MRASGSLKTPGSKPTARYSSAVLTPRAAAARAIFSTDFAWMVRTEFTGRLVNLRVALNVNLLTSEVIGKPSTIWAAETSYSWLQPLSRQSADGRQFKRILMLRKLRLTTLTILAALTLVG